MMLAEATLTRPTMTYLEIPDSPDLLTTAWLTAALRSTGTIGQAAVTTMQVKAMSGVEGNTGPMVRVHLSYDRPVENAPDALIAKFPATDPDLRLTLSQMRMYEKEVRFYETLAEGVNLRTPTCYYSARDTAQHEYILLLEYLAPAQVGDQIAGCSFEQAKMAILSLVELHTPYWDNPALNGLTWTTAFHEGIQTHQENYLRQYWPAFVEKYGQNLPDIMMEIGEAYGEAMPTIWYQLGQSPVTILHGDYRLDNLLFGATEGGPAFSVVDWQLIKWGRGPIDVVYFLGWSVTSDMRRADEMALLQTYHTALVQKGIRDYTFDQCLLDYRQAMFYVLSVAVATFCSTFSSSDQKAT